VTSVVLIYWVLTCLEEINFMVENTERNGKARLDEF
jgi:hypothetical protein